MDGYAAFVEERMAEAKSRCSDPRIFIEQTVRFEEYIPEGFGTADCIILADGLMDVIDLKYGSGVPVRAEDNPQMKIYGLGSYLALSWAYDLPTIRLTIYQPRRDSVSVWSISAEDLLAWAEKELKPKAALAWAGEGECSPGETQCRWCRAAPVCRALKEYQMEIAKYDFADARTMEPEEVAEVLTRLPSLQKWAESVKEYALNAALNGAFLPGLQDRGRPEQSEVHRRATPFSCASNRRGTPPPSSTSPRSCWVSPPWRSWWAGAPGELVGGLIEKPAGAPTLVPNSDKRPPTQHSCPGSRRF